MMVAWITDQFSNLDAIDPEAREFFVVGTVLGTVGHSAASLAPSHASSILPTSPGGQSLPWTGDRSAGGKWPTLPLEVGLEVAADGLTDCGGQKKGKNQEKQHQSRKI